MKLALSQAQRTIGAIVAVCLLPVVIGVAAYFSNWQPSGAKSNGELIQPPYALPARFADSDGRWRIVVAGHGTCAEDCKRLLDIAYRAHVGLYKRMPSASRMWISDDAAASAAAGSELLARQPDLKVAVLDDKKAFDFDQPGPRLYLLDPEGRVALRYPNTPDDQALFKAVLKDLERLLRYS